MVIDTTYFQDGELYIPNNRDINARTVDTPTNRNELQTFIDKYERLLLIDALGVDLYNELVSELQKRPFNQDSTEDAAQKWIDLVNGRDYQISGRKYRWDGLRGVNKDSLIAYFVKAAFLLNDESTYTTEGIVKLQPANATTFKYNRQYNSVFSRFCDLYQGVYLSKFIRSNNIPEFQLTNKSYYSFLDTLIGRRNTFLGRNIYNTTSGVIVGLFEYLRDSNDLDATAFPDFDFKFYKPSNHMGF